MNLKLKFIVVLCCVGLLTVGTLIAQQTKFSVSFSNETLVSVLQKLKEQTGYTFVYVEGVIPANERVTVSVSDALIEQLLDKLLVERGYAYRINEGMVAITAAAPQPPPPPQNRTVSGTVRDENGTPLAGASVLVTGTRIGVSTEADGRFELVVPIEYNKLHISYIGFIAQDVDISRRTEIELFLAEDIQAMQGAVVTGIFNKARESYTGAVTTISSKELETFRNRNLIQTLSNIDPSINIVVNNEWGSNPNMLPQINIRGNSTLPMSVEDYNAAYENTVNTPLIIMDGFEVSLTKLMDYNDDEIESINLLKDAAATAIYGSRGANGVIVIISKSPKAGKLRINFSANFALEMPDLTTYDLLNAAELLELQRVVGIYDGLGSQYAYERRLKNVIEGVDTDWLHYPVRTGLSQRYNLRLEGGNEEFRWGATLADTQTAGVMKGSQRDNFNGAITLAYTYKNIIFRNQLNIGINKAVESPYGLFSSYADMFPYFKSFDEEGNPIPQYDGLGALARPVPNPLYNASLNIRNDSKYTEVINNFSLEWNILAGLTARVKFGISKKNNESDYFLPPNHSTFQTDQYLTDAGYFRKGRYNYKTGNMLNYEGNVTLSYSKRFLEKHSLFAGFDFSIQNADSYQYDITVEGFSNDKRDFLGNALQYDAAGIPTGFESTSRRVGFTGNLNYTYDNRYFADFSYRVDGSSQFGSQNRFAPFWSAGMGWNIHNENFLRDNDLITNLRIRLSYGSTGSQNFSAYQALQTYQDIANDKYLNRGGAYLMALGNDRLKWQMTDQFNTGIEVGLLRGRVDMAVDYYTKKTSNLLSSMDLPRSSGYASYVDNIGEVKNSGFETSLSVYPIRNSQINWMISGRLSHNRNEITKLSNAIKEQSEKYLAQNVDVSTLFYEGYSQNSIWVVRSLGIDPSSGRELLLDKDGNMTNIWQPNAKVFAGLSEPKYRGNLTSVFRYKSFTLNLSFGYHWGGQLYNATLLNKVEVQVSDLQVRNVDRRVMTERWSQPGDVVHYKVIDYLDYYRTRGTTRFVMDDSVFQLQSASLQYRLDKGRLLQAIHMQSLLFSFNMNDLFYISSVKRERGTSYPFARSAGASISLSF